MASFAGDLIPGAYEGTSVKAVEVTSQMRLGGRIAIKKRGE